MNALRLSIALAAPALLGSAQSITSTQLPGAQAAARRSGVLSLDLAGESLLAFPHFQFVRTFHEGAPVEMALDPFRAPHLVGRTADVYLVVSKDAAGWGADPTLVDVAGGPQPLVVSGADIQSNTLTIDLGTLAGGAGLVLGAAYDVVLDFDQDGLLGGEDVIDGLGDEAGFYVVRDTTLPGSYSTQETTYSGGSFLGQNTFWPTDIATLGAVPLVVVSHGNGHNYLWYDHIGEHLASWGYVVMSHQNNTVPGPSAASLTTLQNTHYLLDNLGTIAGGVLNGHVDTSRIVFIGHSRGGEGVLRAYTRLVNDEYTSPNFDDDDIRLISSIAPITFLSAAQSTPLGASFQLLYGASDADVTGSPSATTSKPLAYPERATGDKHVHYLHGTGHGYFHNGTGCVCIGPDLLSRADVHSYELGMYVPLVARYTRGSVAALDFFERMDLDLRPAGVPAGVTAATEYRAQTSESRFVIDDFQTEPDLATSSSGGAVTSSVFRVTEGQMRDTDGSFVYSNTAPLNGMTRWDAAADDPRCVVFEWEVEELFYELEIVPAERDLSDDRSLAFRACQATRHFHTDAHDAPITFSVTLRDTHGTSSTIGFDSYGSITRTYERTGSGSGAGWANEFSTVRLRLTDFLTNGTGLDLSSIEAVRFQFGGAFGSDRGRIGLDDIEIIRD